MVENYWCDLTDMCCIKNPAPKLKFPTERHTPHSVNMNLKSWSAIWRSLTTSYLLWFITDESFLKVPHKSRTNTINQLKFEKQSQQQEIESCESEIIDLVLWFTRRQATCSII